LPKVLLQGRKKTLETSFLPQSSISRIEQRTDMYLSTLRNYVQAMGGVLQIQALFPQGGAILINRFGDYEDPPYIVVVRVEKNDAFQLQARPFHHQGGTLSTRPVKRSGIVKAMKALHLAEPQISTIRNNLQQTQEVEIGGRAGERIFQIPDLVAAGFEPVSSV
jgi:hypothetical protein